MKNSLLIILLSIITLSISAQQVDKAKSILEQVSKKNKSYTSINAEFLFIMDNNQEDIHEKSIGKLLIKGEKYKLSIMGVDTYFNGTTIYSHIINAEEVNISEYDEDEEDAGMSPTKLFSMYEKGFTYKYVKQEQIKGTDYYIIDLFPTNKDNAYIKATLLINKKEMQIYSMTTKGKDGNDVKIQISKMAHNLKVDDKSFTFNKEKYPNVEVNDMR